MQDNLARDGHRELPNASKRLKILIPMITEELKVRGIVATAVPDASKYLEHKRLQISYGDPRFEHQITVLRLYSTRDVLSGADLPGIAAEMAIKMAKPGKILSFPLDVPPNMYEAALESDGSLYVREIVSYVPATDIVLRRFDAFVKWTN